jgi:hypothetical protein
MRLARKGKGQNMKPDIIYSIVVEQDDMPVHGNAIDSGDAKADKEIEDEILARLDRGDTWAWAQVDVRAECGGQTGHAYLGGCSYQDENDFKRGGYLPQLQEEAREDLLRVMRERVSSGEQAKRILGELEA